ncbi:MAG: Rieske 2Fe-2S domain-containing protein [Deltaproteobacteria bacterium]|nr:Rieske 2Fe-2S domain-containing protein [Deltaproteobacteria bacterium]
MNASPDQFAGDSADVDFVHTGPGTLAGKYWRRSWHPVYGTDRLKPGRAVPIRFFSEDFTLYRGESGIPHVVDFRCAHRGTQLSVGWVEGEDIRCFYHGWKYDCSGQGAHQSLHHAEHSLYQGLAGGRPRRLARRVRLARAEIWARELRALAEGQPLKGWRLADYTRAQVGV